MTTIIDEKARVRGWSPKEVLDEYIGEMALRRFTTDEDIAHAVVFLASEESRQITGHEMIVDGGWDV
jgi:3-oxoacyl-[acyl-carrier protein] reductase